MEKTRFPSSGGLGSQAVRNTRTPSISFSILLRVSTLKPVRFKRSGGDGRNSLLGKLATGTKNDASSSSPSTVVFGAAMLSHGYVELVLDERDAGSATL